MTGHTHQNHPSSPSSSAAQSSRNRVKWPGGVFEQKTETISTCLAAAAVPQLSPYMVAPTCSTRSARAKRSDRVLQKQLSTAVTRFTLHTRVCSCLGPSTTSSVSRSTTPPRTHTMHCHHKTRKSEAAGSPGKRSCPGPLQICRNGTVLLCRCGEVKRLQATSLAL